MTMKILHIWNIAGVAPILAKFMNRMYPESHSVVVMRKIWDPWNQTTYDDELSDIGKLWEVGPIMFVAKAILYARKFNLIHIHSLDKIVPWLKMVYPKKPIVLQYHGTDIRGQWNNRNKVKLWSKVDSLIVSTKDLLEGAPANAVYLPNPVDTDLFYPREKVPINSSKAFHFTYFADEEATAMAKKLNLFLDIHDRTKEPIAHHNMPDLLSKYEYYIDIKRQSLDTPVITHISRTALEALSCGLKVVEWNGEMITGLPDEHKPTSAVNALWKIYFNILKKNGRN